MIKYYDTWKFKNIDISNTSMNRVIYGICAFARFVRIVWIMPKERRDSLNIPGVGKTSYNIVGKALLIARNLLLLLINSWTKFTLGRT